MGLCFAAIVDESRRGTATARHLFYPIFVDRSTGADHARRRAARAPVKTERSAAAIEGTHSVLADSRGRDREATGRLTRGRARGSRLEHGYARVGRHQPNGPQEYVISYLRTGPIADIEAGRAMVVGRNVDGASSRGIAEGKRRQAADVSGTSRHTTPAIRHDACSSPSSGSEISVPEVAVRGRGRHSHCCRDKPDAVVLDFFAGSGTTAHAVMRLNRQDGGRRQAIVVTNNEVSADEAKSLTERGLRDGDPEWEALGIFEHITRPRITAAVTGLTPDGTPIKGDYKFTDEFPMAEGFEENVEFMKLTYLDPVDVELDRAFAAVAPMLWLRAGGQGSTVAERTDAGGDLLPFAVADRYGVLFDPDRWRDFVAALPDAARTVFVVTDSAAVFAGVAESLPADLAVVRLYENYLTTFAINQGRVS